MPVLSPKPKALINLRNFSAPSSLPIFTNEILQDSAIASARVFDPLRLDVQVILTPFMSVRTPGHVYVFCKFVVSSSRAEAAVISLSVEPGSY